MTSGKRAPNALGDTRATMGRTKGSEAARWSESRKTLLNTDCRLQPAYMKLESLVIAGQPNCGEYVPGPCTHRPSRHPSWEHLKAVREVLLKVGLARGAKS